MKGRSRRDIMISACAKPRCDRADEGACVTTGHWSLLISSTAMALYLAMKRRVTMILGM